MKTGEDKQKAENDVTRDPLRLVSSISTYCRLTWTKDMNEVLTVSSDDYAMYITLCPNG